MEENKNKELQEDTQEVVENQEETKSPNARYVLWILAGGYLLYTAYSLCKGFIAGEEGTSIGFLLAGIAFAVIGAGLVFVPLLLTSRERKILNPNTKECITIILALP